VVKRLTAWQATALPESFIVIPVGVVMTLPAILASMVHVYPVFWGQAGELRYE
jgi:cytochrome bd-type quinol oxidase subunit 2